MSKKMKKINFDIKRITEDKEVIFTPKAFGKILLFIEDLTNFIQDTYIGDKRLETILSTANLTEKERKMCDKLLGAKKIYNEEVIKECDFFIQQVNTIIIRLLEELNDKPLVIHSDEEFDNLSNDDIEELNDLLVNEDSADKYSC